MLSRGVCWTVKADSRERVRCCVAVMDLDVLTCHLLHDTLRLFLSIYLGWNYPWKIQKFDAFLAEDDADTVGIKYRSGIVKKKLFDCSRSGLGLNRYNLVTPVSSGSGPVLFSLCICPWVILVSASWLFLIFFHKLQRTGNVPVPSTKQ